MTDEDYRRAAIQLIELLQRAQTEEERLVALNRLDALGKMSGAEIYAATPPRTLEFDKKNSRREAIMAQRAKRIACT